MGAKENCMSIEINYLNDGNETYLYCHYDRQTEPQDCFMELDPRERSISCDFNGEIGNATPMAVYHGTLLRFSIPILTATAANRLMEDAEVHRLIDIICNGYTEDYNDQTNLVGTHSDESSDACIELEEYCRGWGDDDDKVKVMDAGDFLVGLGDNDQTAAHLGITADSTDKDLESIEAELQTEASLNGLHDVRGLSRALENIREELGNDY